MRPFLWDHARDRRVFNYRLSRARLVVECAFGQLSARWRMYRRVIATTPEITEVCVKATCVLHNFLRMRGLEARSVAAAYEEASATSDGAGLRDAPQMGSNNASRRAIEVREAYTSHFNEEGAVPWQWNVV